VKTAAAALARAYSSAAGGWEGAMEEPDAALAVKWLRVALSEGADGSVTTSYCTGYAGVTSDGDGGDTCDGDESLAAGDATQDGEDEAAGAAVAGGSGSSVGAVAGTSMGKSSLWSYKSWGGEVEVRLGFGSYSHMLLLLMHPPACSHPPRHPTSQPMTTNRGSNPPV
jgi:hypothetical protein